MVACAVPEQQLVAPRFTRNLENVVAHDGREVTMSCSVAGTPTPEVSWFHNHKNIDASEDFVINYDRTTGRVELVIVDCLPDDQVRVLESDAVGPGFESQPRRCPVTVLGKLFTPIVLLFTKQRNWQQPS